MRTIAIVNQKGGCGKTTTAVNVAAAIAGLGKKVLIIDLDPQGHATLALGANPYLLDKTIYDAITDACIPMSRVIMSSNEEGLDLAPSNILLSGGGVDLSAYESREYVLSDLIESVSRYYEICVIDCSPSLGLLTLNALVASSDVIIPVQSQYYAIEGLRQVLDSIEIVQERFNQSLNILGILLTFVDKRTMLSRQVQEQLRDYFGDKVFNTVIHRTVRLAEAPSAGKSVISYAPECRGAFEYQELAKEIFRDIFEADLVCTGENSAGNIEQVRV